MIATVASKLNQATISTAPRTSKRGNWQGMQQDTLGLLYLVCTDVMWMKLLNSIRRKHGPIELFIFPFPVSTLSSRPVNYVRVTNVTLNF